MGPQNSVVTLGAIRDMQRTAQGGRGVGTQASFEVYSVSPLCFPGALFRPNVKGVVPEIQDVNSGIVCEGSGTCSERPREAEESAPRRPLRSTSPLPTPQVVHPQSRSLPQKHVLCGVRGAVLALVVRQ